MIVFTVYPVQSGTQLTGSYLSKFREEVLEVDDVFQSTFIHNMVFFGCEETQVDWHPSASAILQSWGVRKWVFGGTHAQPLPAGPYVSYLEKTWQLCRIYTDDNLTMVTTFRPLAPVTMNPTSVICTSCSY